MGFLKSALEKTKYSKHRMLKGIFQPYLRPEDRIRTKKVLFDLKQYVGT